MCCFIWVLNGVVMTLFRLATFNYLIFQNLKPKDFKQRLQSGSLKLFWNAPKEAAVNSPGCSPERSPQITDGVPRSGQSLLASC